MLVLTENTLESQVVLGIKVVCHNGSDGVCSPQRYVFLRVNQYFKKRVACFYSACADLNRGTMAANIMCFFMFGFCFCHLELSQK